MENRIGERGEELNDSVASRAVNLAPDMRKVARLDIYHRKYSTLRLVLLAVIVGLLVAGAFLWAKNHQVWGGLVLVLALPVVYFTYAIQQTLQGAAYSSGLLIPGVVTAENPLTIICLADVRTSDDDEDDDETGKAQWGVKQVVVKQLTVQPERVGEPVPCVALFGGEEDGHYTNFEPRPLAWGTDSAAVIAQARAAIDAAEWALLTQLAAAYPAAPKDADGLAYFAASLRPVPPAAPKPVS